MPQQAGTWFFPHAQNPKEDEFKLQGIKSVKIINLESLELVLELTL